MKIFDFGLFVGIYHFSKTNVFGCFNLSLIESRNSLEYSLDLACIFFGIFPFFDLFPTLKEEISRQEGVNSFLLETKFTPKNFEWFKKLGFPSFFSVSFPSEFDRFRRQDSSIYVTSRVILGNFPLWSERLVCCSDGDVAEGDFSILWVVAARVGLMFYNKEDLVEEPSLCTDTCGNLESSVLGSDKHRVGVIGSNVSD